MSYFPSKITCLSWASLSSNLLSTTAHIVIQAPADSADFEEAPQSNEHETASAKENNEDGSLEAMQEMLQSFDGDFIPNNRALQKKAKKIPDSQTKKKGKGTKKKPQPVVAEPIEESDAAEEPEESDDEENDAGEVDSIVVGNRGDESEEETSSTVSPQPTTDSNSNQESQDDDEGNVRYELAQIGENFQHYEVQTCTEVEVPLDPKGIEVTVNPEDNLQRIMVTNTRINDCGQILDFVCPQNAKFCQELDLSEATSLKLGEEVCHHTTAYLYLLPTNAAISVEFSLRVSTTNEVECPANTNAESAGQPATDAADESVEQNNSNSSHVNVIKILVLTCAISLGVCLVFVCFYRYQFRTNKRELCSPPSWCPNFLFPRMSNQMERFMSMNKNNEQEMVADYQPPVL